MKTIRTNFLVLIAVLLVSVVSFAQSDNFSSLIDMKASYLDQEMANKGYVFIKTVKQADSAFQNWYSARKNKCVTVKVFDGRVESIVDSMLEDCGKGNYSNNNNNDSDNEGFSSLVDMKAAYLDQEMKGKGYVFIKTDKVGNSAWQNWYNSRKNKCVTVSITDGRVVSVVNSTLADCGKGKYGGSVSNSFNNQGEGFKYSYLSQKDAVWAYEELSANGFMLQKTHQQGGNTYKIWYNSNTNQCVKTTSKDKLISVIENSSNCTR